MRPSTCGRLLAILAGQAQVAQQAPRALNDVGEVVDCRELTRYVYSQMGAGNLVQRQRLLARPAHTDKGVRMVPTGPWRERPREPTV